MRLKDDAAYLVHGEYDIAHIAKRLNELENSVWLIDVSRQAGGNGPHDRTNSIILNYCRGEPEYDRQQAEINKTDGWVGVAPRKESDWDKSPHIQNLDSKHRPPWNQRHYEHFLEDVKDIKSIHIDDQLNSYTDAIVKDLEHKFNGVAGLVVFAKLPAKTVVGTHTDGGYYLSIVHRLHIPIITNDLVNFNLLPTLDSEPVSINMKAGILYEINNQQFHGVENRGDIDRIHLIIDIIPKDKIPG